MYFRVWLIRMQFSDICTYLSFFTLVHVFSFLIYSNSSNKKANFQNYKHDDLIRENESVYERLRLFWVYIWNKCGNVHGYKLIYIMLESREKCFINYEIRITTLFITVLLTLIKGWIGQEQTKILVVSLLVNTIWWWTCPTEIVEHITKT